jgi:peptide/nickel transport system ATP-binding protein
MASVPSRNRRGARLQQIPGMTPNMLLLPEGCAFRTRCPGADAACAVAPAMDWVGEHGFRCVHPLAVNGALP